MVIHQRDSWKDTLNTLKPYTGRLRGVFHCFSGDTEQACHLLELGHALSFTGIVTFKNARDLQAVAQTIPLDCMLVETDSPYLAPVPHRGKTNQPAWVRHVAEFIADLRGVAPEVIAEATTANFERVFLRGRA